MKSSLTIIKIILTISIIVSIGTALGATVYFGMLKNNLPIAVQPTPTITPILTPTVSLTPVPTVTTNNIDTSDWKTYRNEQFGYEIKYPNAYIFDEKGNSAEYDSEKVRLVNFNINQSEITHSFVSVNNTEYMNSSALMKSYDPDKLPIVIDGMDTFLYISKKTIKREYDCESETPCTDSVLPIELRVKKNTDMFMFSGFFHAGYLDKSIEFYKKIFSTFKFLERDENGKIIVNVRENGYEFQYPDNYFSAPPEVTVVDSDVSLIDTCPVEYSTEVADDKGNPLKIEGEKVTINEIIYCKYIIPEAHYARNFKYLTIKDKKLYTVFFIWEPSCSHIKGTVRGQESYSNECSYSKQNEEALKIVEKVISSFKFTE